MEIHFCASIGFCWAQFQVPRAESREAGKLLVSQVGDTVETGLDSLCDIGVCSGTQYAVEDRYVMGIAQAISSRDIRSCDFD